MRRDQPLDRIAEAGADTARIAQTTVLVKLAERPGCPIHAHPAWALCRALRAAGFGSLHVRGSMDYFDDLDSLLRWDDSQEPGAWFSDAVARMAPRSDIIIDVSNDVSSRARSLSLKKRWSADRVCVAWDSARVSVSATADSTVGFPRRAPDQRTATPMTCRLAAGLALSEALFTAGRWNNVAPLAHPVVYDAASPTRTGTDTVPSWPKAPVDGTVIDVIGAGGSGTNLLEALVPALGPGSTLRIFDADTVADENLATQPAFGREDLGLPKADAIAARLAALSPGGPDIVPFPIRYEEAAPNLSPPSLRITCPDSFAARAYVNSLCTQDGVPLADAGTAPLAAQVRCYRPGATACLSCRIPRLDQRAAAETATQSCAAADRALATPATNMIAGALLAFEALRALRPEIYGAPSRSTILYDARVPDRLGLIDDRPPCAHGPTL